MNTNQNNTIDDLLVSYLLGEATEAERKEAEAWIAASPENKKYFEHFKTIWDESKLFAAQRPVSENDAWQRLVNRALDDERKEQGGAITGRSIPLFQRTWMRAAAVLLICVGLGGLFYKMNNSTEMIVAQAGNTTLTETLPDGSVIVLNRNASLSYPSKFNGNTRSVKLTGEAFFTITPDKSKPFIIDANNTTVTVVGTSFNVKTSPTQTEVIVETGIVEVMKEHNSVRVMPNQKVTVTTNTEKPKAEANTDELYNYYRTGEFVCNATPLYKLTDVLNEAYDAHIVINDPQLREMPITTTFKNEPLDDILKIIAETMNLTVEKRGRDIYLNVKEAK